MQPSSDKDHKHMTAATWIPILCYHDLTPRSALAGATPYALAVEVFEAQMRLLHTRGYRSITVQEAARYVEEGRRPSEKVVAITFDDGYQSLLTRALPVLEPLGYTATAYLIADYLLDPPPAGLVRNPGEYLDIKGVEVLQSAGWELGAHTRTHPDLTTLDDVRLENEIRGSREALSSMFHDSIATFCYPYHRRSPAVEAHVAAAGFRAACGGYNTQHRLLDLSRINAALYSAAALATRCSQWFWWMRTHPMLRTLKRGLPSSRPARG
jgi:peptidoglycan/xylan/chitin deacetylase (PgdA/CDA1 family)